MDTSLLQLTQMTAEHSINARKKVGRRGGGLRWLDVFEKMWLKSLSMSWWMNGDS